MAGIRTRATSANGTHPADRRPGRPGGAGRRRGWSLGAGRVELRAAGLGTGWAAWVRCSRHRE